MKKVLVLAFALMSFGAPVYPEETDNVASMPLSQKLKLSEKLRPALEKVKKVVDELDSKLGVLYDKIKDNPVESVAITGGIITLYVAMKSMWNRLDPENKKKYKREVKENAFFSGFLALMATMLAHDTKQNSCLRHGVYMCHDWGCMSQRMEQNSIHQESYNIGFFNN